MRKIAIMQPYLFPYIGYWQLMESVDIFVILDDVNYINRGFINRNYLLVNEKQTRFTLELQKASQNKLIKDIYTGNNSSKILKKIFLAYKRSLYFDPVYNLLEDCLHGTDGTNLSDLLFNSINKMRKYLNIKSKLFRSSDLNLKNDLKGNKRIIQICKEFNASTYINNISGSKLYQNENFLKNNIELFFLESKISKYKQFSPVFVPYLSIIDTAMFNSSTELRKMLLKFTLY